MVTTGHDPKEYGKYFDTISICLSKGLGAPVGSVVLYKNEYARKTRRIRKVFGGGMRQAGYLAAAGIYALDNNIERMSEDHRRAKRLGKELENLSFVEEVYPVETNIVIFKLSNGQTAAKFLEKFKYKNILAVSFGKHEIRFVTHLDFNDEMLEEVTEVLKELK